MGLYSALRTGVASIDVNSSRMGMIGDNIANVNTVGYKRIDAKFSTFVDTDAYGSVTSSNHREIDKQAEIYHTAISTDLAVSGNGYFAVVKELKENQQGDYQPVGETYFTRSGEFRIDNNGFLRNTDGYYLLSWPPNENSSGQSASGEETTGEDSTVFQESNDFSEMTPANVGRQNYSPETTTEFNVGANIVPTTPAGADNAYRITQGITDTAGRERNLNLTFEREPEEIHTLYFEAGGTVQSKEIVLRTPNSWRVYANVEDASIQTYDANGDKQTIIDSEKNVPIADMVFDANGKLSLLGAPGAFNMFLRSNYPLSFQQSLNGSVTGVTETGATNNLPYDLDNASSAFNAVRDLLIAHDIPATAFSNPPTAEQIRDAITALDTSRHPYALMDVMAELNNAANWQLANSRNLAGLPNLQQGIDDLFLDVNPDQNAIANGATTDAIGAKILGGMQDSQNYLGGRIVNDSGDGYQLRQHTHSNAAVGERLQAFASDGLDKVRVTVDYDNSSLSQSDQIDIDIDFGSLTLNSLGPNSFLNNSNNTIATLGEGRIGNNGLTQYDDISSSLRYTEHNGRRYSLLDNVEISREGVITGHYDNGESRDLYQIPLVVFDNANGLTSRTGSVFERSTDAGSSLLRRAGSTEAGYILSASRESANVDLEQEFSNMIVTQRIYSASTKIITTTDAMLDELNRSF
ncbi:MAG: flagellar hook-basal body complex protein [Alphaproteobacteria bacterium]|nr:flagellar hook-basal body complex protein [Alphaproteobacteria bacterium]